MSKNKPHITSHELHDFGKVRSLLNEMCEQDFMIASKIIDHVAYEANKRLQVELFERDAKIKQLEEDLSSVNKIAGKLSDNLIKSGKQNDKLRRSLIQAHDFMQTLVNKMMIQTIAQKTHGERNQQLRDWSRRLLQIIDNISNGNEWDDIPF